MNRQLLSATDVALVCRISREAYRKIRRRNEGPREQRVGSVSVVVLNDFTEDLDYRIGTVCHIEVSSLVVAQRPVPPLPRRQKGGFSAGSAPRPTARPSLPGGVTR